MVGQARPGVGARQRRFGTAGVGGQQRQGRDQARRAQCQALRHEAAHRPADHRQALDPAGVEQGFEVGRHRVDRQLAVAERLLPDAAVVGVDHLEGRGQLGRKVGSQSWPVAA